MDLRQLRYFIAVATELSFTKAAARLHVSQPPLSQQIASLEDALGARLFERSSRHVRLTEAGKALLHHAQAVMARLDDARLQVKRIAQGLEGRVRIGLTGSHFLGPFPDFIMQFRSLRPGVEVLLNEMTPAAQLAALRDGQLDLSFERGPLDDPELACDLLWKDSAVVVLPPGHALARRKQLRLKDLRQEDFVFLRRDSSKFVDRLHEACVADGYVPRIVQQVVEVPAVLNLVAAGLGVSVVPGSLARLRGDALAICTLAGSRQRVPADVYLVRRKDLQSPAALAFSNALRAWSASRH